MVGYHFFGSGELFYEKGPYGVFFRGCSNSLNMNVTKFSFIGLVKLNIERPFFWGMNPSFLRFVKYMGMDSSSDNLKQVFVTLFELIKTKRGTHQS